MEMEKKLEVSLLLDFYGGLLKPSGRQAVDLYYNDDLSLAEIAEEMGITRQGVRDRIKRSERQLFDYERQLGLYGRFRQLEEGLGVIYDKARRIAARTNDIQIRALADEITAAANELKEKE